MFNWKKFTLRRLYGLDKKTNVMDVKDGYTLDCENVFQDGFGRISKKRGTKPMFTTDTTDPVDEIGSCILSGTTYYFRFSGGDFFYSTTLTGALTALSPSPAIGTEIWWAVVDEKLYFVDGTNVLRFFDGTAIVESSIKARPTVAPTVAGGAGTFTYLYTVDNGQGESPGSPTTGSKLSAQDVTIPNAQIDTGDKVRVYSNPDTVAATSLNVTGTSGGSNVTYGSDEKGNYALVTSGAIDAVITTVAISDSQSQLYTQLGEALNISAPTGLEGIMEHYGRLVAWIGDTGLYFSKQFNPNSWPATEDVFFLPNNAGSNDPVTAAVSFLESLYVFQEKNVTVFGGVGPTDTGTNTFTERRLEANGNGCIAGKSAKVTDNYLVYLSRNGFFATNGTDPDRVGEKIEPEVQNQTAANLASGVAFYHKRDGIYVCTFGSSLNRMTFTLDVRKDNDELVGWFKWVGVNIRCVYYDNDRYLAGLQNGLSVYEDIVSSSTQYTDATKEVVIPGAIDTTGEIVTVTRDYATGTPILWRTTGTLPAPLVSNTTYYAIRVSATEIQLATSLVNAEAGTEIDLTTTGSGSFSLISQVAFEAFYTTNWINHDHPSYVKKLGKLGVLLDVSAQNISIDVYQAINWTNTFQFQDTITISSTNTWGSSSWGSFIWGAGNIGTPKNVAISRRKVRSVRYKFMNSSGDSNFNLLGIEQLFDIMRNRGNFAA